MTAPIDLYFWPTPNGWKVNIMIEELIEAGIDVGPVEVRTINLMKGEQFEDDFTERNPNQKIPTLRDGDRGSGGAAPSLQDKDD